MPPVTKNLRDAEVKLYDGTGSPNEIILALEEGDLTFETTNNVNNILDRGILSHMRKGDEAPVPVTFTMKFTEMISQGSNPVTVYEAVEKVGAAAAWITTNTDGGDVYTLDMEVKIDTPTSGEDAELILLEKLHGKFNFAEGDEYDTLTFEGEAFITRPAISKDTGS